MKKHQFFKAKNIIFIAFSVSILIISLIFCLLPLNTQDKGAKIDHNISRQYIKDGEYVEKFDTISFSNLEVPYDQINVEITDDSDNSIAAAVSPSTEKNCFDINMKFPYYGVLDNTKNIVLYEKISIKGDQSTVFDNEIPISVLENKQDVSMSIDFVNTSGYTNEFISEFSILSLKTPGMFEPEWNFEFQTPEHPELAPFFKTKTFIKNSSETPMVIIGLGYFPKLTDQPISVYGKISVTNEKRQLLYSSGIIQVSFSKKAPAPVVTKFEIKNTIIKNLENKINDCAEITLNEIIESNKISTRILDNNNCEISDLSIKLNIGSNPLIRTMDLIVNGFIQDSLELKFEISWENNDHEIIVIATSETTTFQHLDTTKAMSLISVNKSDKTGMIEANIDGTVAKAATIKALYKKASEKITAKIVDMNGIEDKNWAIATADITNNEASVSLQCLTEDAITTKGRIQSFINGEFSYQTPILSFNRQYKAPKVEFYNLHTVTGKSGDRFSSIGQIYVDQKRAGRSWFVELQDQIGNKVEYGSLVLLPGNNENLFNISLKTVNSNALNEFVYLVFYKDSTRKESAKSTMFSIQLTASPWIKITNVKNYYSFEQYKTNGNLYKDAFDFEISQVFDASEFASNISIEDEKYEDTAAYGKITVGECHINTKTRKGTISLTNFSLEKHSVIRKLKLVSKIKDTLYSSEYNDFTIMNEISFNSPVRDYAIPAETSIISFATAIVYEKTNLSVHFMNCQDGNEITTGILFTIESSGSMRRISAYSEGNKHQKWDTLKGFLEVRCNGEKVVSSTESVSFQNRSAEITFLSDTDGSERNDFAATGPLTDVLKIRVRYAPEEALVLKFIDEESELSVRWWDTYGTTVRKISEVEIEIGYFFQINDHKSLKKHAGHFEVSTAGAKAASHNREIHIYYFDLDRIFYYQEQTERPDKNWMLFEDGEWLPGWNSAMFMDHNFGGTSFLPSGEEGDRSLSDIFFTDILYKYYQNPCNDLFFKAKVISPATGKEEYNSGIKPVLEFTKRKTGRVAINISSIFFKENVLWKEIFVLSNNKYVSFAPIKLEMYYKGYLVAETAYHKYWDSTEGFSFDQYITWMGHAGRPCDHTRAKNSWCN